MQNKTYPAEMVWAASCAAQRVNGAYLKFSNYQEQKPNRHLMIDYLDDSPFLITEVDYQTAETIKRYYQGFIFKLLSEARISNFEKEIVRVLNQTEILYSDFGILAAVPSVYQEQIKRDIVETKIANARGGHIGNVGDRIAVEINLLRSIWSNKWAKYFNTGITVDDKLVLFSSMKNFMPGNKYDITAKVGQHIEPSTTRLFFVKAQKHGNTILQPITG